MRAALRQMLFARSGSGSAPSFGGPVTIFLAAGQSNATRRASKVTTAYDPRLYCFVGANETVDRTDGQSVTNSLAGSVFASLVAFNEFGINSESIAPGFAAQTPVDVAGIITHTPAIGARHYRELCSGSGSWDGLSNALRFGKKYALTMGATSIKNVVLWDHGESDADSSPPGAAGSEGPISKALYLAVLQDLRNELTRTVKLAQADSSATALLLTVAPCSTQGAGWRNVQDAHVEAAITIPGINLVGPKYAYAHESDGVHITGAGKRLFAEYTAFRQQDVEGGATLPVLCTGAARAGAVCTLSYNTISGNLVIDTTAVPETTTSFPNSRNGYEAFKASDTTFSTPLAISSVAVSLKDVIITLSADPGEPVFIRYAQMTWPGASQSVAGPTSKLARGNIRDSGTRAAVDGSTLYNWACHQGTTTGT